MIKSTIDWQLGYSILSKSKMFILWGIGTGLCKRMEDIIDNFDNSSKVLAIIEEMGNGKYIRITEKGNYYLRKRGMNALGNLLTFTPELVLPQSYLYKNDSFKEQQEVIIGFLSGDSKSYRIITSLIRKSLQNWQIRLGYEIDDLISIIRLKLYSLLDTRMLHEDTKFKLNHFVNFTVSNTCIDFMRRSQRKHDRNTSEDVNLLTIEPTQEKELELKRQMEMLSQIMSELSFKDRELLEMYAIKEYRYKEIARLKNTTSGHVATNISRIRKKILVIANKLYPNEVFFKNLYRRQRK